MGKKKFDQDKAKRRWFKKITADPETMESLRQVASFCNRIGQLQTQLSGLMDSIDQSDLFVNESHKWPHSEKALPLHRYTINDAYWWEYGDNSDSYGVLEQARNLALYASIMERDGMGA